MEYSERADRAHNGNLAGWFARRTPPLAEAAAGADLMARASAVIRMLLVSLLCGLPILGVLLWPAGYRREALVIWVMIGLVGLLYFLLVRGRPRAAFCGLVATLIAYAVAATIIYGSVRGTGVYAFFGAVFVAGLLFTRSGLVATLLLSVLTLGGLIVAERGGALGAAPDFSVGAMQWINHVVALSLLAVNVGFVRSLVMGALARAQAEAADRQRAEEALHALNAELETRVRERTQRLEMANRELEAFSYSVSHDLRSPLRAIDGFLSILAENTAHTLAPADRELIARVLSNCGRMDTLISDLLNMSRISRIEVTRERVDLSALALELVRQLQQAQPGRVVQVSVAGGLVDDCDPALLRMVLTNLLGNAWKFSAKAAHARIEFGAAPGAQGRQAFFVRDNGAGFDMRYAGKLFTPFQRMHRQDEFEGSGVGLVIVQRIIARHGGSIEVEAAPGMGATFRFTLSALP